MGELREKDAVSGGGAGVQGSESAVFTSAGRALAKNGQALG